MSDQAYKYALNVRSRLEELWQAIDADEPVYEERHDAYVALDEYPLEVIWETGEEFAVVLTVGGPHAEIAGGGRNGAYRLTVRWGTDVSHVSGEAITRTGEYFRHMVED